MPNDANNRVSFEEENLLNELCDKFREEFDEMDNAGMIRKDISKYYMPKENNNMVSFEEENLLNELCDKFREEFDEMDNTDRIRNSISK